jgi:hypothetical protein
MRTMLLLAGQDGSLRRYRHGREPGKGRVRSRGRRSRCTECIVLVDLWSWRLGGHGGRLGGTVELDGRWSATRHYVLLNDSAGLWNTGSGRGT